MSKRTTIKDLESQIAGLRNRLDDQRCHQNEISGMLCTLVSEIETLQRSVLILQNRCNSQFNLLDLASLKLHELSVSLLATNHVLERNGLTNPADWVRTYQRAVGVHDQICEHMRHLMNGEDKD